jgi:hypothetical protein
MTDTERMLVDEIRRYILVLEDIRKFNNKHQIYLESLEDNIISMMNKIGIDTFSRIKKEKYKVFHPQSVEEIKKLFNDPEMVDGLVVKVLPELTLRNLKLKNGLSDKLANSYMDIVNDLMSETHERLVLKK